VELLYDVNLQQLPDDVLVGVWRVTSRVLSQADPTSLLARATDFDLRPTDRLTIFAALPDEQQPGTWAVQRPRWRRPPTDALFPVRDGGGAHLRRSRALTPRFPPRRPFSAAFYSFSTLILASLSPYTDGCY
jgi:hypothetical protein